MQLHSRVGAFITSQPDFLIEIDDQLGYMSHGVFVVVCDLRKTKRARARKSAKELLEEFLKSSPNMRELAKAGQITLSVQNGCIYCHGTLEGFKANGPGSANRMQAIDNWMKANLTPEQYAEEKRKPKGKLEGAELDAWAKARFDDSELEIAQLKRSSSSGHRNIARSPKVRPMV